MELNINGGLRAIKFELSAVFPPGSSSGFKSNLEIKKT